MGSNLPEAWRSLIVESVTEVVGAAQIFLIGSRARGEARSSSDCDVSVVLPSRKIFMAARRLPAVAAALSKDFGISVSVNPVPKFLFFRAQHNLYVLKIRMEGIRLDYDTHFGEDTATHNGSWTTSGVAEWNTRSPRAHCAEVSYLLSAVHVLLEAVEPRVLLRGSLDFRGKAALRKANAQVAQACLLARGQYVVSGAAAVEMSEQLGLLPIGLSGIEGFFDLRWRLLHILGPNPVSRSGARSTARDLQYVALSSLRGHQRWSILRHYRGIEARLASASLLLLQALSAKQPEGYNARLAFEASLLLPPELRPRSQEYEVLRDVILSEWVSAQPLVGVIP